MPLKTFLEKLMFLLQSQAKNSGFEIILLAEETIEQFGQKYYYALQKENDLKSYANFSLYDKDSNFELRIEIDCPCEQDEESILAAVRKTLYDSSFNLDKELCFDIKEETHKMYLLTIFTILFDYLEEKYPIVPTN